MKGRGYTTDHNPHLPDFQKRECHSADAEVDSRTATAAGVPVQAPVPSQPKKQKKAGGDQAGSGGGTGEDSIEVIRRPRGRPPGSKNKPKPPVVITRDAAEASDTMRSLILDIPAGHDVTEALSHFCRRRNLGISLLAGTGAVSNVTLRQPSLSSAATPAAASTVTFHGRFDILSISATFFPPSFSEVSGQVAAASGGLSISLAGPQGQIVGGSVAGPLLAEGTVTVVAAAFSNPTFHRLPAEEDLDVSVSVSISAEAEIPQHQHQHHHQHQQQQQQQQLGGGGGGAAGVATRLAGGSAGMGSIYGGHGHITHDPVWTPAARTPQHPPF